jgi:hypothetical protein
MKPLMGTQVSFERLPLETGEGTVLRLRHLATGVSVQRVVSSQRESHGYREMLADLTKLVRKFEETDDATAV